MLMAIYKPKNYQYSQDRIPLISESNGGWLRLGVRWWLLVIYAGRLTMAAAKLENNTTPHENTSPWLAWTSHTLLDETCGFT
jgi:hypothetical protein